MAMYASECKVFVRDVISVLLEEYSRLGYDPV
jgi:hypothetical protein